MGTSQQFIRGMAYTAAGIGLIIAYFTKYGLSIIIFALAAVCILYGLHLMDAYRLTQQYIQQMQKGQKKSFQADQESHQSQQQTSQKSKTTQQKSQQKKQSSSSKRSS